MRDGNGKKNCGEVSILLEGKVGRLSKSVEGPAYKQVVLAFIANEAAISVLRLFFCCHVFLCSCIKYLFFHAIRYLMFFRASYFKISSHFIKFVALGNWCVTDSESFCFMF